MTWNELTPKQKRFALELVQSRTLTEAAQRAGISISTAKRYKQDPLVRAYIEQLAHELLDDLALRLRQAGIQAVETLHRVMVEGDSWSARIRAADSILGHLLKVVELVELERRVQAIERQLREVHGAQQELVSPD